ncbi:MAG: glycerophosphodiester phosphodiesterase [Pirellulales bacterium]
MILNRVILILGLTLLFATSVQGQFIVAHRGASYDAPENTLAAFQLAWEQGADAIEADFYLTKDKQIVCMHDKSTRRTAPDHEDLIIAKTTLEQLSKLDVGAWKDKKFTGEKIPTFQQVLSIVPNGKKFFVEIKCGPEILPIMKPILEQSEIEPEQIVIICFDSTVVTEARKLMPQYRCNWLTGYKQDKQTGAWGPAQSQVLETLQKTKATGLGSNFNRTIVNAEFMNSVVDAGLEFHVWTVNDVDDALYFSKIKVASITTDRPGFIRKVLQGEQ